MSVTTLGSAPAYAPGRSRPGGRAYWGALMLAPYLLVFLGLVLYPVAYGLYLGLDTQSYRKLFQDPIFYRTAVNTILFLTIAVNLKLAIALALSGFFVVDRAWVRVLLVLFILPWAVPSIPTILSFRVMLNPENGMINQQLFRLFGIFDGPPWLTDPRLAFASAIMVHIWKSLPFWTLILVTGRLAIAKDLYEAASVDGASRWQQFRHITWPSLANLYLTSTILSMIWTLGDFNSVYLLTGGGPADQTQVLATLGIRYMRNNSLDLGIASIIVAMPLVLPLVFVMVKRLSKGGEA
ncbi:sugar ABC transporter permease [Chelatococcus sp. SYSU_G07232]|uniref:Sugar ABC transporter permease n=1 Tax=Chelatococcus albus TaxID=3047466 RepID=A0ABT7AL61_9HYPH|nr:sugar ABC transporter permease [Chelatococcus sp. SYSU_G07232]MDJ1160122.1 sugar ABC transporter permease [Chelatococcus sp. SYSU_G07232]